MRSFKAQVSFFMIIGVLAVLIISIALFTRNANLKINTQKYGTYSNIYNSVDECISNALFYSAYYVGINGGYVYPRDTYATPLGNLTVALKDNQSRIVTQDVIISNIETMMSDLIPICANDIFSKYSQYEITAGQPFTQLTLTKNTIDAKVTYSVKIKEEGKETELKDFTVSQPIRLGFIVASASEMINRYLANGDKFDINYITGLDFNVKIIPYDARKAIVMTDMKSTVKDHPYIFIFLI